MAPAVASITAHGACAWAASWADAVSTDLSLESSSSCGKRITRNLFIYVDSLRMLTEIIKP